MKVLFFALGTEIVASSRTRIYQYLPYLRGQGISFRVIHYFSGRHCRRAAELKKENIFLRLAEKISGFFRVILFLTLAPSYDALFMQRVLLPLPLQRLLFLLNKRVVFDFDDALFVADRPSAGKTGRVDNKFIRRLENMLKLSKCVIIENGYNRDYARRLNPNTLLITGPIDIHRYYPADHRVKGKEVVLGWIGSPATSFYLEPLYGVFETLAGEFDNLTVKLIGFPSGRKPEANGVDLVIKRWSLDREAGDLQDFDIGLMPLYDDRWSRGKGGYKLLQYMALGIPCVASPVGVNKEIIREGQNGFLADGRQQWVDKLSLLIRDQALREKMGRDGRRIAEEIYSYEVNTPKLIEALRTICS